MQLEYDLREKIEEYEPFNEQEEIDKSTLLEFMDNFDDVLTRKNIFGHISASAFVLNEDFTKGLFVYHNIFNGFVYPGGHADGEKDLWNVAKREVYEETGINVETLFDSKIFAIQAVPIKGHVKKGKYVSAHIHYDILYLLVARNSDVSKIRVLETENSKVKWLEINNLENEDTVDWINPIISKIVKKIEVYKKI